MKRTMTIAAAAAISLAATGLRAEPKRAYAVSKIAEGLYELSTDGGGYPVKVVASAGADGLLIVDSGEPAMGPALAEALAGLGKGLPKIVVNTHSHIEHLGGNPAVARGALIIGHRNLRERYLHGLYSIGNLPPDALPSLTFTDSLTLHFNGEDVRLVALGGAHDDSDVVVWFERSKVAVVGALCMCEHFPSIDGDTADIRRYPELTAKLLAMLPEDTRLVSAHASDCDMAQGRRFLDMLRKTSETVRIEMSKGRDLARLQSDDVLAAYASWESSYVARGDWVEWWYAAYARPRSDKPRPLAPVIAALRARGVAQALTTWADLRRTRPDDYWYDEKTLLLVGRRLARFDRFADARPFLERCIQEFPRSDAAAASHRMLATVSEAQGDLAGAELHLRAYLEKQPRDVEARAKLVELEGRPKK